MKKKEFKRVRKLAMLLSATLLLEQPAIATPVLHVQAQEETVTTASDIEASQPTTEVPDIETPEVNDESSKADEVEVSDGISVEISEAISTETSDEISPEITDAVSTETSNETSEAVLAESSEENSDTNATDTSNESSETDSENATDSADSTDPSDQTSETDATDSTNETTEQETKTLKEKATEQFTDIPEKEWYADAVQFVYSQKIMNGVADTLFGPGGTLTREQFITVIYNMENKPETTFQKIYEDVADEALWYAKPVTWASINGITSGIGDGMFGTGKEITREQLATLLYNYAKEVEQFKLAIDEKLVANFPDADQISDWATSGMTWAITNGVMSGKAGQDGKNFLDPKGNATRAECAQMIKNLKEKALKGNDSEESEEEKDNDPLVGTEKVIDDQTIVNIDTSSASKPVGKIFYKELVFEDEISHTLDGLQCVRDQILLYVNDGVNYDTVDAYVKEDNARIVGCIESIGWYQIEFNSYLSAEKLGEKRKAYEEKDWVSYVGYNLITEERPAFHSSDPFGNPPLEEWNSKDLTGDNWAIEEIDFAEALLQANVIQSLSDSPDDVKTDHLSSTKIGIYDSAFDWLHEDLSFEHFHENSNPSRSTSDLYLEDHGTAVAGIIGATFNNDTGLTGISIKSKLYGYSAHWDKSEYADSYRLLISRGDKKFVDDKSSISSQLIAFALMITVDEVKVINYSWGYDNVAFAMSFNGALKEATRRKDNAENFLKDSSATMAYELNHFIKNGYDFLIVTSAGNSNNEKFYRCDPYKYTSGYISETDCNKLTTDEIKEYGVDTVTSFGGPHSIAKIKSGVDIDAKYNSPFNYIPITEPCYDHIICVGAMDGTYGVYTKCNFSNVGERVDLYAPGISIYTCSVGTTGHNNYIPNFKGTSAAAPFVTGSIGLAYSVEPTLKATDIKKWLVRTSRERGSGSHIIEHVLNVGGLIKYIVDLKDSSKGILSIHVTDPNGKAVPFADVRICQTSNTYRMSPGWILLYDSVDPYTFCQKEQTDINGDLICKIDPGFYMVLIDSKNLKGNMASVGWFEANVGHYHDGVEVGKERSLNMTLQYYSEAMFDSTINFQVSDDKEYVNFATIRLYKGWGVTDPKNPVVEVTGGPGWGGYNWGWVGVTAPRGCYTAEIEKEGYETTYMDVLITGSDKDYMVKLKKK